MNKKGTFSDNILSEIPKLIILIILMVFLVFLINIFTLNKLDVQELEASLLVDRMIYSKNCILYIDDYQRPYPGIIDPERFKSVYLDECIFYEEIDGENANKYTSAKLTLTNLETDEEKIIYNNEEWYNRWVGLVGGDGPGGTKRYEESNYVLIKTEEGYKRGKIDFDVILPNS